MDPGPECVVFLNAAQCSPIPHKETTVYAQWNKIWTSVIPGGMSVKIVPSCLFGKSLCSFLSMRYPNVPQVWINKVGESGGGQYNVAAQFTLWHAPAWYGQYRLPVPQYMNSSLSNCFRQRRIQRTVTLFFNLNARHCFEQIDLRSAEQTNCALHSPSRNG
jgi:hypothetical protein